MSEEPAGWFYVGNGRIRYRDDYGWTDFYMSTADARAQDWPPPTPKTMLREFREEDRRAAALRRGRVLWWRRGRR